MYAIPFHLIIKLPNTGYYAVKINHLKKQADSLSYLNLWDRLLLSRFNSRIIQRHCWFLLSFSFIYPKEFENLGQSFKIGLALFNSISTFVDYLMVKQYWY